MYSSSGESTDTSQISFESGKPVREAALAKLSEFPDLMWLIFTGAQVTDEQLERVAKVQKSRAALSRRHRYH